MQDMRGYLSKGQRMELRKL